MNVNFNTAQLDDIFIMRTQNEVKSFLGYFCAGFLICMLFLGFLTGFVISLYVIILGYDENENKGWTTIGIIIYGFFVIIWFGSIIQYCVSKWPRTPRDLLIFRNGYRREESDGYAGQMSNLV